MLGASFMDAEGSCVGGVRDGEGVLQDECKGPDVVWMKSTDSYQIFLRVPKRSRITSMKALDLRWARGDAKGVRVMSR
eukprot:527688-Prorocentrum_minimum.AAC.2